MNMNNQGAAIGEGTKSSVWIYVIGVILVLLGIACVVAPVITTMVSLMVFGWLLILSGIIKFIYSFSFWKHDRSDFFVYLLSGIVYLVVGVLMIYNPVASAATLTILLAVFFLVLGLFRVAGAIALPLASSVWVIINGILAFILGVLILVHWPSSAYWVIGLFLGIDLIFGGITLLTVAHARKKLNI